MGLFFVWISVISKLKNMVFGSSKSSPISGWFQALAKQFEIDLSKIETK
jgi:hypothetical protein